MPPTIRRYSSAHVLVLHSNWFISAKAELSGRIRVINGEPKRTRSLRCVSSIPNASSVNPCPYAQAVSTVTAYGISRTGQARVSPGVDSRCRRVCANGLARQRTGDRRRRRLNRQPAQDSDGTGRAWYSGSCMLSGSGECVGSPSRRRDDSRPIRGMGSCGARSLG